jgi:hypothetical protein
MRLRSAVLAILCLPLSGSDFGSFLRDVLNAIGLGTPASS